MRIAQPDHSNANNLTFIEPNTTDQQLKQLQATLQSLQLQLRQAHQYEERINSANQLLSSLIVNNHTNKQNDHILAHVTQIIHKHTSRKTQKIDKTQKTHNQLTTKTKTQKAHNQLTTKTTNTHIASLSSTYLPSFGKKQNESNNWTSAASNLSGAELRRQLCKHNATSLR